MSRGEGRRGRIALWQNLAILVLSLSAVLLLIIVGPLELSGENGLLQLSQLISGDADPPAEASDLSAVSAPVNLVLSNEYGRRGELLTTTLSESAARCGSLIREAVGSAYSPAEVEIGELSRTLEGSSLFMDFLFPLPAQVVASYFGTDFSADRSVRCLMLAATGKENCVLYLWDGEEAVWRYSTAVPESTLLSALSDIDVNGARFACEAGEDYDFLFPLTVLPGERVTRRVLSGATASGATDADRLLGVAGFNVHTNYRYPEGDGTQVIVESPRTLRIRPDGVVEYTGDSDTATGLFLAPAGAEEEPGAVVAALTALRLAEALLPHELSGSGRFFLTGMERGDSGWKITLGVHVEGVPVYHSDAANAAEVTFTGGAVTGFVLHCRSYTAGEEEYRLLPLAQAAAMAAGRKDAMLTVGYVDRGSDRVLPTWLLQ